jgi:hypothetical protein
MRLKHNLHLAYCTNIHPGEDWAQTFAALQRHTLAVRERVCPGEPYAIGLRLSARAAQQLSEAATLRAFQQWLDEHQCYVFTINGFPYGRFHGTRVKEQVYLPDWTTRERLEYTNLLFDLLVKLVPAGVEGSVSTVPGSFKEFIASDSQVRAMQANLWACIDHIEALCRLHKKPLHLGLEPEPLCYLETSTEVVTFLEGMRAERPKDRRLTEFLGVNYDTCHLAVEFETAAEVVRRFREFNIRISKIHLSSALKVQPTRDACRALRAFTNDTYLHQVIERRADGELTRYRDLDVALARNPDPEAEEGREWRIHFHVPLHSPLTPLFFRNTSDHLVGLLDELKQDPTLCSHLEMETYTWDVLPPELKQRTVVDQLAGEYEWALARLRERGLA